MPAATLVALAGDGYAALLPDGGYKLSGDAGDRLWWLDGLRRLGPDELDASEGGAAEGGAAEGGAAEGGAAEGGAAEGGAAEGGAAEGGAAEPGPRRLPDGARLLPGT